MNHRRHLLRSLILISWVVPHICLAAELMAEGDDFEPTPTPEQWKAMRDAIDAQDYYALKRSALENPMLLSRKDAAGRTAVRFALQRKKYKAVVRLGRLGALDAPPWRPCPFGKEELQKLQVRLAKMPREEAYRLDLAALETSTLRQVLWFGMHSRQEDGRGSAGKLAPSTIYFAIADACLELARRGDVASSMP